MSAKSDPALPQRQKTDQNSGSEMLTPSELETLRQNGHDLIAFMQKEFGLPCGADLPGAAEAPPNVASTVEP